MTQHAHYWSCTSFADWLRGTSKPYSATMEDWEKWRDEAETAHPVRYWLTETALGRIQDFVFWPKTVSRNIEAYVNNRYLRKTHVLTSSLPRGKWYELDTRILHCVFDEFVRYVEVDCAYQALWSDEMQKSVTTTDKVKMMFGRWRSAHHGLFYLSWAANLKGEDGVFTSQADVAQRTIKLYHWWKGRDTRPDPYDESGFNALASGRGKDFWRAMDDKTRAAFDQGRLIEEAYEAEDRVKLMELIDMKESLWT